jgi:hypothetical protein
MSTESLVFASTVIAIAAIAVGVGALVISKRGK